MGEGTPIAEAPPQRTRLETLPSRFHDRVWEEAGEGCGAAVLCGVVLRFSESTEKDRALFAKYCKE